MGQNKQPKEKNAHEKAEEKDIDAEIHPTAQSRIP